MIFQAHHAYRGAGDHSKVPDAQVKWSPGLCIELDLLSGAPAQGEETHVLKAGVEAVTEPFPWLGHRASTGEGALGGRQIVVDQCLCDVLERGGELREDRSGGS